MAHPLSPGWARQGGGANDPTRYHFETGTQGFTSSGGMITGVPSSTTRAYAGTRSLAVKFNGSAGSRVVRVSSPGTPAGATVTYRVWIPSNSGLASVHLYVQQGASGGWAWTGAWRAVSSLTAGAWNTITVTVPANASALSELGVVVHDERHLERHGVHRRGHLVNHRWDDRRSILDSRV